MRTIARLSITASKNIPSGQVIERDSVVFKRPGLGLPPKYLKWLIGKKAKTRILKDEQITFDQIC
jgi:sialic acid synthase SpsE